MTELSAALNTHWENILAVSWFLLCFKGYSLYANRAAQHVNCLASEMHQYRVEWMKRMLTRENRIADTSTIANLERSVAFFASTTLLILAGLITVVGSTQKAIDVISDIPFASQATTAEWELKLLLMVILFIFAFFKFTWSLRQYGFASVMIGGAPLPTDAMVNQARTAYALRISNTMSLAAGNFNTGLRTYYFSMAVLGWFINPWIFMGLSTLIMLILYRREFKSRTLAEMLMSRSE
ncbi:MAG: DUF599 family protein [Gammaproteobacteria bacterium]|nr:DUF599 family protein [Gammaproteobacteria bacterium]MBL6998641.1 DUF599 family protein [Gammaproteobacteria bacterium]